MVKKKISKLNDRDEDFFKSRALKERKLAVTGKWDSSDTYNLQLLFENYDKHTGGLLKRFCSQLAAERTLNGKIVMKNVNAVENIAFALPQDLQLFMERYYPSIWTNPDHAREFVKRFPMFRR